MMFNDGEGGEGGVHEQLWQLATAVRDGCFAEAVTAYEDARMDGLCHEGAWECAADAMRSLDFQSLVAKAIAKK